MKPYSFEITINSNSEPEDNHLKMLLLVELPFDYPNTVPHMRLKNLSPDYLDNRMLDDYEVKLRAANHENIGSPMIFETCELLREEIAEINDSVLDKFNGIIRAKQE